MPYRLSRPRSTPLWCLMVVIGFVLQLGTSSLHMVYADSNCDAANLGAGSGQGLSLCQKDLYSSGVHYFDSVVGQNCGVTTAADLSGSNNTQIVFNFLNGKQVGDNQLTAVGAAGIVGNLLVESGEHIDPTAKNPSSGAFGIAQWLGGRYTNLVNYANSQGTPVTDFTTQLNFLWQELSGPYKTSVLDPLLKATNIAAAATLVEEHYEVAGGAALQKRIADAQSVYNQYGGSAAAQSDQGDGSNIASAGASGSCSASGPGEDTQYVDGFTIYSQYDKAWADNRYGTSTIAASGCGPSAMAMIITALSGKQVTPADTTTYANTKNIYIPGSGSSWSIAPVLAQHWGLTAAAVGADTQKIAATLQAGGLVIGSGIGGLPFTSAGHYIVIRGIAADGKWLIGDSAHKDTNTQEWSPQQLLSEMNSGSIYAITKGATT